MSLIEHIFREYPSFKNVLSGDKLGLWLNIIGGTLMGIFKFGIGFIFLRYSGKIKGELSNKRRILAKLLGLTCVFLGLVTIVVLVSFWKNYFILNGCLRVIAGSVGCISLVYAGFVVKGMKNHMDLDEVKTIMQNTSEKIDKLNEKLERNRD